MTSTTHDDAQSLRPPVQPGAYDPATAVGASPPRSLWRDAWGRIRQSRRAMFCVVVLLAYVLVGLIGFTGVLSNETVVDGATIPGLIDRTIGKSHQPPSWTHPEDGGISPSYWLGLDFMGRSVFWRLVYGTRVALTVALLASIIEIVIGFTLGAVSGYFGGIVDALITWLFSTVASVPWILLMISFAYVLKNKTVWGYELTGVPSIVLALGLTTWVGLCRLIRGEVLKHRDRDYVLAARAIGLGHGRIVFRHILPNVFHLVIINFALGLAAFVHAEVILSFLGLGVTEVPSWGRMIDDAKLELLKGVWWPLLAATVMIFVFSLAVNLFGDTLRDALDPRLRGTD
ncbi:MAG TPA: ABC transporter permease [Tepidisphaeraceae bacterium]|nr:ABC transporter permease [Tepidisphaeraceae bacterium]